MRLFAGGPDGLISKVLASDTARIVGQMGKETIVVITAAASLSVVHYGIRYTGAPPEIQSLFTSFHLGCLWAAYVLLAARALQKLVKM